MIIQILDNEKNEIFKLVVKQENDGLDFIQGLINYIGEYGKRQDKFVKDTLKNVGKNLI